MKIASGLAEATTVVTAALDRNELADLGDLFEGQTYTGTHVGGSRSTNTAECDHEAKIT